MKVQLTDPIDTSTPLLLHEVKCLQQIIGTFLFYGHAVDPTILTALSELSSNQATTAEATKHACHQFLDYCASHPNDSIRYHASDMVQNSTATPPTSMLSEPAANKEATSALAT